MSPQKVRPEWVDRDPKGHLRGWRAKAHEIIFEADTPVGKAFDVALIVSIVLSVIVVMLDSVGTINRQHGSLLYRVESVTKARWISS